ncbi:hypothetical protein IJE86_01000 [bacterium]|nr:hypothetical protein [bacterium]
MKLKNIVFSIVFVLILLGQNSFAQDYSALKSRLINNFPNTFEGKPVHPRTYSFGMAIINQLIEDFRKIGFDESNAYWLHATDYVLYDANTNKRIGNTYWIVYKSEDDKVIGTYMMNCENPANNRLMHTSYKMSGGSYKIKKKITLHNFSHIVCKQQTKRIQRF